MAAKNKNFSCLFNFRIRLFLKSAVGKISLFWGYNDSSNVKVLPIIPMLLNKLISFLLWLVLRVHKYANIFKMTPEIFSCKLVFSLLFSKQIQSISTVNVINLIVTTKIEQLFMCIHVEAKLKLVMIIIMDLSL